MGIPRETGTLCPSFPHPSSLIKHEIIPHHIRLFGEHQTISDDIGILDGLEGQLASSIK